MLPESQGHRNRQFVTFGEFYGYSRALDERRNERLKLRRMSIVADLLKERSTRSDIPFRELMQADLVVFVAATVTDARWYPKTLIFAGHIAAFPLFLHATQHKNFEKLKISLAFPVRTNCASASHKDANAFR